ncbi:Uncharacterized membrane protein YgdD, TMEM256/DUF423 family [Hydrobacter penzbergensis]|uniref:Uncharacterized membrane protein YgdD, TMEM256/DUF423 family n=1 Tax=Hydrobacter penzbergensis TaxID=1235997 RepID=A0A8X8ICG0_9BACT|nr:DUF423 domain-containing protein [Hydrobacter penzbergensis]SDW07721.1 Uncharacterized membrane protein YgdD, TMEM256/DUF423 family [Hydrobacter penzbergensis]
MHKGFLTTAALLGCLAVALGAFGAHALKAIVTEQMLNAYETGVRYQFYHVFALALTALCIKQNPQPHFHTAGRLFITGIILFSGSLYVMTWLDAAGITGMKWIGAITPLGGLAFVAAWVFLALGFQKAHKVEN